MFVLVLVYIKLLKVCSNRLSVSLCDWSELSCDSDNPFSQLPKKIAIDKINAIAIIKKLFVCLCDICYFLKKFIQQNKNLQINASACNVKFKIVCLNRLSKVYLILLNSAVKRVIIACNCSLLVVLTSSFLELIFTLISP